MIDERTLQLLEWSRIADAVAARAATPYGQETAREMKPLPHDEAALVRRRVAAWRRVLDKRLTPPLAHVPDVRPFLLEARRGAALEGVKLLDVAAVMEVVSDLGRFLSRASGEPLFASLAESLPDFSAISQRVRRVIDPAGGVREDASDALLKAAHEERVRSTELREKAELLLDDERLKPLLRDRYVTQREGRFVLPIRIDRLTHQERGIVHDASATGMTVFFEPEALNFANNRLVEVKAVVREEMARLLGELSASVAAVGGDLEGAITTVAEIDAELARARLAQEWEAVEPVAGNRVRLRDARQPLLLLRKSDQVVAVDLEHDGARCAVILSGPNAGGKTAALKTLGLCFMLAKAGCHVPAREAMLPLEWDVGVELGDPQNLGEDLSTFSGHLARLTELARAARPGVLLLVDEILKGTDPTDGAPLARAWLEEMVSMGAAVWVTTHYGSLKALPAYDDRFTAARVAYEAGRPAYAIVYGEAGPSYAFETAERLGFAPAILARAASYRRGEETRAERALAEVDDLRKELTAARKQADTYTREQGRLRDRLQAELQLLQSQKTELVRRAAETTLSKIDEARQTAEKAERSVKRRKSEGRKRRVELGHVREEVERTVAESEAPGQVEASELKPGSVVYSRRLRRNATVLRAPERGQVALQVGKMQVSARIEDLAPARADEKPPARSRPAAPPAPPVPEMLDVRGQRLDDALRQLDKWLDQALLARQTGTLTVLHGVGTGALRDGVRTHLREHPGGFSFAPADPQHGGDGATRIEL